MECLVELNHIEKAFPGVRALHDVTFNLRPGEVHVLLGENGAGKSTLMKVLSGNYQPDSGEIKVLGNSYKMLTPKQAKNLGISTIHQEFNLIPQLSIAQNIFLGHEFQTKIRGFLDQNRIVEESRELLERVGLNVDPNQKVGELGVAQQQLVELAKALSFDAKVLIMDEPTATLSNREIERLFEIINQLKQEGVGIVYISHRLQEVHVIGDRVSVLRDGEMIATNQVKDVSLDQLVAMMVGRSLDKMFTRKPLEIGSDRKIALKVRNLTVKGLLKNINLEVKEGEIVGLAGLVGAGRTELAKAIFGAIPIDTGEIELFGTPVKNPSPQEMIDLGMGLVPENRKEEGIIQEMSIRENITMASLRKLFISGLLSISQEKSEGKKYVKILQIMTDTVEKLTRYLSGGNQQKVVVGKWLCCRPRLLIFDEPTRGIDVGAKAEIHKIMDNLVNEGVSILMISSELPEVIGMSDRIYVMREGEIVKEFSRQEATQERIINYAMGGERSAG